MNAAHRNESTRPLPVLLVRRIDAAAILTISPAHFDKLVKEKPQLLKPVRIGSAVRGPYENLQACVRELAEANETVHDVWDECAL